VTSFSLNFYVAVIMTRNKRDDNFDFTINKSINVAGSIMRFTPVVQSCQDDFAVDVHRLLQQEHMWIFLVNFT